MSVLVQTNQVILVPNANYNVDASDTGKILMTPQTAGAVAVVYTLPAPAAGLHFRFVNGAPAALSGSVQINTAAAAAILFGNVISGPTLGVAFLAVSGSTQIRFLTAVSVLSDYDLYSDGTNWYVNAMSHGGRTVT